MGGITNAVGEFIRGICPYDYLSIFIISLIPTIETKGAIPLGIAWGKNPWLTFLFSTVSSLIMVPIILLLFRPILEFLKRFKPVRKLALGIESLFQEKAEKQEAKEKADGEGMNFKKMLLLFLFVGLPLPLTGVWMGSGIAVFLSKKARYTVPPIVIGCIFDGLVLTTLIVLFGEAVSDIILLILGGFMLVGLVIFIIRLAKKSKKQRALEEAQRVTLINGEEENKEE